MLVPERASLTSTRDSRNRVLLGKADFHDVFRKVSMNPDHAHSLAYHFDDLVVIDFRLTSG